MQTLDIISVNIWQIIISLSNLVILFLLVKKFLFKPVKSMIAKREEAAAAELKAAEEIKKEAIREKMAWDEKMAAADDEADEIIKLAKFEANLEHKAAEEGIKREIVDLSSALTGKLLSREINPEDHSELIDEFINEIGEIS